MGCGRAGGQWVLTTGAMKEVAVIGYDPKGKVYTYDGFDSMGMHELSKGTISGKTWTWLSPEQDMGGKKIKRALRPQRSFAYVL